MMKSSSWNHVPVYELCLQLHIYHTCNHKRLRKNTELQDKLNVTHGQIIVLYSPELTPFVD